MLVYIDQWNFMQLFQVVFVKGNVNLLDKNITTLTIEYLKVAIKNYAYNELLRHKINLVGQH